MQWGAPYLFGANLSSFQCWLLANKPAVVRVGAVLRYRLDIPGPGGAVAVVGMQAGTIEPHQALLLVPNFRQS